LFFIWRKILSSPKVLFLDIETSPNVVHCWGLFNQFIGINQIIKPSKTISWAAKWFDEDVIMFDSVYQSTDKQMLDGIYKLINEADVLIHYNGKSFDIPVLNRDFILHGLTPPKPTQEIDLLTVVRRRFRFASNKLQYVVKELGLGEKVSHEGHELWVKCMEGDKDAWFTMERYNRQDVLLTEKLYKIVRGWVPNHPNLGMFSDSVDRCCPNCGGTNLSSRGYRYTKTRKYKRYKCRDKRCGKWSSSNLSEKSQSGEVLV
jgi:hypothetical protein